VPPGTYEVKVKQGDHEATGQVEVRPDPRRPFDAEARRANWEAQRRLGRLQDRTTEAVERVRRSVADIDTLLARAKPQEKEGESAEAKAKHDAHKELAKEAGKLKKELEKLEARLWQGTDTKGIPPPDDALSQITTVQWLLSSTWDPPTAAQAAYLAEAEATLRAALAETNKFLAEDLAAFRKKLQESDLRLLQELPPLEIPPG
jgi:ABC-type Zn2+ transport system substrate-binding protein/surface adhesin